MGLGAYHGFDDNDRRREIVDWFLADSRYPEDKFVLEVGRGLIEKWLQDGGGRDIFVFPGVGRIIYIHALMGLMEGEFRTPDEFPEWLRVMQAELATWLREAPRRKSQYFLDMANLVSYDLLPDARDNPRGQLQAELF
jgi:hypothetical protein